MLENSTPPPKRIFYGWYVVYAVCLVLTTTSGLGFYNLAVLLDAFVSERGFPVALARGAVGRARGTAEPARHGACARRCDTTGAWRGPRSLAQHNVRAGDPQSILCRRRVIVFLRDGCPSRRYRPSLPTGEDRRQC